MAETTSWDETVDVVVVGSGAGAMTAAITAHDQGASVMVIEKSDRYGGSSAMSGGSLWIPCNHLMKGVGVDDSPEEALTYLRGATQGTTPDDRLVMFVEWGPRMLKWVCDNTRLKLNAIAGYADYYPRVPGSKPGARTVEARTFDARVMGDEILKMRDSGLQTLMMGRISFTAAEARILLCRNPGWIGLTMKLMMRYFFDIPWRFRSKRDRSVAMGNGLVAPLRMSLSDRKIPLHLETPCKDVVVENGRVVGVIAEKSGRTVRIRANKGVILGAGGFEGSQAMRDKYLPSPAKAEWSCANPASTGDIHNIGLKLGVPLERMDDGWWGPVTVVPGEERARMLVIEKSLPGGILVNKKGQRFVNEAAPYVDVVNAMYANNSPENPSIPAYLIFDARYRKTYPIGPFLPGAQQPDSMIPKALKDAKYLKKADTLAALAAQIGVDAAGLEATIARFNENAKKGVDPDFQRGETVFDKYYGDQAWGPNESLGPIVDAPFYAMEAWPGELGTKGGLRADRFARVEKEGGEVIEGLYAIGNCSSPLAGCTYPGAGGTIGPAMTFGHVAGLHVTGKLA